MAELILLVKKLFKIFELFLHIEEDWSMYKEMFCRKVLPSTYNSNVSNKHSRLSIINLNLILSSRLYLVLSYI